MRGKVKNFILDLLYPKFCFNCGREGSYLCSDCQSTLEILSSHTRATAKGGDEVAASSTTEYRTQELKDLYFALPYRNPLIKNLTKLFKYEPFVKELAQPLTSLIITHFQLIEKSPADLADCILMPVPLEKRKLKWRGFNQAEEIGRELAQFFQIPLLNNVLAKIKETPPQVELSDEERKENIKGAFFCQSSEKIKGKKILLVDDIYTTGSTMEECAKVLKTAGAKEIIGIVVARG